VRLDPLSAIAHDNLAISLYQARQSSDETLSEARAALELDPSDTLMKRTLAAVYELRGEHGEAVAARQRFERLRGTRRSLKAAARFGRLLNEILVADRHASAR
jgi:DNA-binding SARP family transcriptional activator